MDYVPDLKHEKLFIIIRQLSVSYIGSDLGLKIVAAKDVADKLSSQKNSPSYAFEHSCCTMSTSTHSNIINSCL